MNVIYLISRAKKTAGPVNQALNILTGLNKIPNVHAVLATLSPEMEGNSWLERFDENGIKVVQFGKEKNSTRKSLALLKSYIKENQVDVVHSAGYRADFVNMCLKNHVATITTQRSLPNEIVEKHPKLLRPFLEKAHLSIIKRIDVIVACSKTLQRVFEKDYHMSIEAVQNSVNTDHFVPVEKNEKKEIRKGLGLPENGRVFLVLGALNPRKNNALIIDAFKSIERSDIRLVFVGTGSQETDLKELAKKDDRIVFAGVTGNSKQYYQAADILVSSSLAEGLPNTVLEAIACGLPCILSDIEPHKEIIENEGVGEIFERKSKEQLVRCISDSFGWDMQEMSKKARLLAENHFSAKSLAERYLTIYKKAINEKK